MLNKLARGLMHVLMFALVCAGAAYWGIRLLTPAPSLAPPPPPPPLARDPDPVLAARLFGLVQMPQVTVTNVQVAGVFAAGADSSAVLIVDGKPPRVFVIGQEIVPGTRLAEVRADAVVLETSGGARQEVRAPARPAVAVGGPAPVPAYVRQGNVLSAPGGAAGYSAAPVPPQPSPQPVSQPMTQPTAAPPPPQAPGIAPAPDAVPPMPPGVPPLVPPSSSGQPDAGQSATPRPPRPPAMSSVSKRASQARD